MDNEQGASEMEALPDLYAHWLQDVIHGGIPREHRATCSHCVMGQEYEASSATRGFHPGLKCCTFLPDLPNFLVGGILEDQRPANETGRESVLARLRRRSGVNPLGFFSNAGYSVLYDQSAGEAFGKSPALLCPHFESEKGQCSIWAHRNSVCTTYFCRHSRGAVGADFWQDLKGLLRAVEVQLSWWCVLSIGDLSPSQIRRVRRATTEPANRRLWEELTGAELGNVYDEVWGRWLNREVDFYRNCARLVRPLSWADIQQICGPELEANYQLVAASLETLRRPTFPSHVSGAAFRVEPMPAGYSRVSGYSQLDPIVLHENTLSVLGLFDGRPTEVCIAEANSRGGGITKETVQALCDWGIFKAGKPEPVHHSASPS